MIGTKDEILKPNWVFAGSILWEDPDTGDKLYQAEGGDLVCVSNFSTATLDIPLESSQVNSGLMFASFSEHPPLRTPFDWCYKSSPKRTQPIRPQIQNQRR
ncbi:MAG: YdjY domain-containing protein [Pirellulaceae bacterium]